MGDIVNKISLRIRAGWPGGLRFVAPICIRGNKNRPHAHLLRNLEIAQIIFEEDRAARVNVKSRQKGLIWRLMRFGNIIPVLNTKVTIKQIK